MREVIKKVGISSNPACRLIAEVLRASIKVPLLQLLRFRKDSRMVDTVRRIEHERGFMMWPDEMAMLYAAARAMNMKEGDFAEVGVSSAGSAKLLCELKNDKPLHLFDTFQGLPNPTSHDSYLKGGQYKCSLHAVKEYLGSYNNVFYYPGFFPDTAKPVEDKIFSLVHLDADLYQSTLDGLRFFYPRLEKGGMLISHDYSTVPGVRRAFDEYFGDKSDSVIELPTSQCLVVKG